MDFQEVIASAGQWFNDVNTHVYAEPESCVAPAGVGLLSVKDFGAIGDGVTDDSAAINAAINSVAASGGGVIHMPTGVYSINSPVILKGYVILSGEGFGRTIIKGANSTSHDLVVTDGFATLVGTNTTGGPRCFGLRDLTIDGNRWNRTGTGTCLLIYGYDYELTNIEIYDSRGIGFYSEWAISGNVPVTPNGKDTMESHVTGLRTFRCGTDGMVFNGPHDTIFRDILTFINAGRGAAFGEGATYTAGGVMVDQLHSYGNGGWGVVASTLVLAGVIESESNTASGGVQVNAPGGRIHGGSVMSWGNTGVGVELNAPGSITAIIAHHNTGNGLNLYSTSNQLRVTSYFNGGDGVRYNGNGGNNTVSPVQTYNNTGKGVYISGNDNRVTGLSAISNGTGGIQLSSGIGGLRLDGECTANGGVQADFGVLNNPAIIDLLIYTNAGQTAWSGDPGNNFVRVAARGSDIRPISRVQT